MQELIKISKSAGGRDVVSARELHKFLEATERFSVWFERQLQYGFKENKDYRGCKVFNTLANQELTDYVLTIDTAKEISMIQRSEKGKIARLYFIECERKLKEPRELTRMEILTIAIDSERRAVESEAKVLALEAQKVIDQPKVEMYDELMETETTFDFQKVSAMLNLGYGRNALFKKLVASEVLMPNNVPYVQHITSDYFKVVETSFKKGRKTQATVQTRVTQKGLDWLFKSKDKL